MRVLQLVLILGASLTLLVAAVGFVLYLRDYTLEATVAEVRCSAPLGSDAENEVDVRTKFLGIDHTVAGVPDSECRLLREGNFVQYHIRSHRTLLFDSEGGTCIYDSERGVAC